MVLEIIMDLISERSAFDKEEIKIEISNNVYSEIQEYYSRAALDDISHFFEESSIIIFYKDNEWKQSRIEIKSGENISNLFVKKIV